MKSTSYTHFVGLAITGDHKRPSDCPEQGEAESGQCSATLADASRMCDSMRSCMGYNCGGVQSICQLRFAPLAYENNKDATVYLKDGAEAERYLRAASAAGKEDHPASCRGNCSCPAPGGLPVPTKEYRGFKFYSADFHISPIADIKDIFERIGWETQVIDQSYSGHCHLKGTCSLDKGPNVPSIAFECAHQQRWFEEYKNNPITANADAFLCNHATASCEAYMPMNASLLAIASTRFEIGRHEPERWRKWIQNLRLIASDPRNVVAANNMYDVEYVRYFTGLKEVLYVPSLCDYTKVSYTPVDTYEVVVGPRYLSPGNRQLVNQLMKMSRDTPMKYKLVEFEQKYTKFEYSDLVKHPAFILFPYQVSIMTFFELYRMNVPILTPSRKLLAQWHINHGTMDQLTWMRIHQQPSVPSPVPRHACAADMEFDPNDDTNRTVVEHWLQHADYFVFPHVLHFDALADIPRLLETTDLMQVSRLMTAYNIKQKAEIIETWKSLFERMFHGQAPGGRSTPSHLSYQQAITSQYGEAAYHLCNSQS